MKVIVGLGNPGDKYKDTRHNAGFMLLDRLACESVLAPVGECVHFTKSDKFEALIGETIHRGDKIILVKPQTFMNLSGKAVSKIMSFYKAEAEDLIVVSDDIDLPIGMARIREEGSSGGQKGLQSIIDTLGSDKFARVRIGIRTIDGDADQTEEPSDRFDATNFVLSKFTKREVPVLTKIIDEAIKYIEPYLGEKQSIPSHTIDIKVDSL